MNTLLPEAPPSDVLLVLMIVVACVVFAVALLNVMFGKSASERYEELAAEEDLAEQAFALSKPGPLEHYQPIHPLHPSQPPRNP